MFRTEVSLYNSDRISGDVHIAVPTSWKYICLFIFSVFLTFLVFLFCADYSRVESVAGVLIPDKGISAILPTRNGVIVDIAVRAGQNVAAGGALATVRVEEDGAAGMSTAAQIETAIARQDASLSAQVQAAAAAARAQQAQLAAQHDGLTVEIEQVAQQVALQRDLIASAQKDYDRASTIAARGFVSQRDLQAREETLLARRQGLAQLNQSLAAKRSAKVETERRAAQIAGESAAQTATLAAHRAEVAQQAVSAAGSRAYVLRAPVSGRVTALTARVGQPANQQTPLMMIIPSGSTLHAELAIPSAAIGFVRVGQDVRLAIDAFPYQRFGTVTGRIVTIASSSTETRAAEGRVIAAYPVTVKLDSASVAAYGKREPLMAGMTLSARIVTEKQSLLQWLFEPLFAVRRR